MFRGWGAFAAARARACQLLKTGETQRLKASIVSFAVYEVFPGTKAHTVAAQQQALLYP